MQKISCLTFGLLISICVYGQMTPVNTLHLVDLYSINAAHGGLDKSLSANFNYRDQWTGVFGNPEQIRINAHLPVALWDGGAGMSLDKDGTGNISRTTLTLSANKFYRRAFGLISVGGRLGMVRTTIDGAEIITPEGNYDGSIISHEDPLLSPNTMNGIFPRYAFSTFIGHQNFDLAISVSNIFSPAQQVSNLGVESNKNITVFSRFPIRKNQYIFLPSFLLRTDFKVTQTQLSCLIKSGSVFGGLALRGYSSKSVESLGIILGMRLNKHYSLSYGYDYGLSDLAVRAGGTHELNINYNLNKLLGLGLPPEIIYNPRNL